MEKKGAAYSSEIMVLKVIATLMIEGRVVKVLRDYSCCKKILNSAHTQKNVR